MARRYYSSTAVATTLSASANNSVTSITVTALSGYPNQFPFTAIIDPDTASEEVVTVTAAAGLTLTVTRGVDGTSGVSHNAGAVFRHGVSARDFDEANAFVNGGGVLNSLVTAKGQIVGASASGTPAVVSAPSRNGLIVASNSSATAGAEYTNTLTAPAAADVVLSLKGAASQTGNLFQTQNSAGTILSRIDKNGRFRIQTADDAVLLGVGGDTMGVRISSNASGANIEGVDSATFISSYQPLTVGGSLVAVATSGTERMRIDSTGLITGTGPSLGAWTAYTSTLGGTGWAIGDGTASGAYCQIGKTVTFRLGITFGTTSTFGAGALTVSVPVAGSGSNVSGQLKCFYQDTSAGASYAGVTVWVSSTTFQPRAIGTGGVTSTFTTSAPFAWASTDIVYISGTYQTS